MKPEKQKKELAKIINLIDEKLELLKSDLSRELKIKNKISELIDMSDEFTLGEDLFDYEEMASKVIEAFLENSDYDEVERVIYELRTDIEEYIHDNEDDESSDELDSMMSKLGELEDDLEPDKTTLDDAIERLNAAKAKLEKIKNGIV